MPNGGRTTGRALVGQGREAEIFAWDDDTVLRLLRGDSDLDRVQREEAAMRFAAAGGVDVPEVRGTTIEDGRAGLIMERIDGPDLITLMGRRPWSVPRVARIVGTSQARMHDVVAPRELPDLREHVRFKINFAEGLPRRFAELALAALEEVPDGDRLCHGDFHPGNVLLSDGGAAVIDWTAATRGDPAGDLARTRLLLQIGAVEEYMPALVRRMQAYGRRAFLRLYLRAYRRTRSIDEELVDRWEVVRAADRIFDGIDAERPALLALLERRTNELV